MIHRFGRVKGTLVELISEPMSPLFAPPVGVEAHIEQPITVGMHRAAPEPAGIGLDQLRLEPLLIGSGARTIRHTTEYTQFIGEQLLAAIGAEVAS